MSTAAAPAPYADRRTGPRPALPWWAWALAAAAIFAAAVVGVLFVPPGSTVAVWWPAAALSVLLGMLQPPSRLPLVLALVVVVSILANLAGDRALLTSLAFGLANAAEVAVIVVILGADRRFELSSLRAGLRFAVAVIAGALAAGVLAAAVIVPLEGGTFWQTVLLVAASHAAAVGLLAPLAALPPPIPVQAGPIEMTVQIVLLAAAVLLVFGSPSSLPLAFAPFPLLAWAALRFPIRFVLAETIVASLLMLAATIDGGGPFHGAGHDPLLGSAMFELLLMTFAGFAVVLSSAQYELRALARQLDASNRLLTGSVIDVRIGLVVAERGEDATLVRWANRAGRAMLADELSGDTWRGPLRAAAATARRTGEQVTVSTEAGRIITVAANDVEDGGARMTVQLLDVTTLLRARQAQVEAEVEREAARTIRAELERQRDDFLVTTSHELRTPITSIVGYAALLLDGTSLSSTEREWVRVIDRNAHRLAELVEDLLTLGRAGAAEAPQHRRERLPCAELFEEVAANLRLATERKLLRLELEPRDLAVLGARSDVSRMLSNLVVNACKFTPEGGTIRLSAHPLGQSVQIRVADTGPGMSEPERALAFDRFYRAPAAERDNVPGTGLGLPIVAELARRNGGSIALRGGEPVGLVAELVLPAAAPDGQA